MKSIACFGDSLVQGFPYGNEYSWIAAVEKATGIQMLNYGLCGDCCDDILYRMRQYPLPNHVKHVLFLGGANDVLQGVKLDTTMLQFKRLLDFCDERGYKLCIVLPLISSDEFLNRPLLNLKQEIEHRLGDKVTLLDLQPAIGLDAATRKKAYIDCVHPTTATYEAMGLYAAERLKEWVEE